MPAAQATYTITQLAQEFDLTPRAIRHYEEEGLITPRRTGQSASARRIYSPRERVRVMLILRGKRLGMSLSELKEIFDLYDADKTERAQLETVIDMLTQRKKILEQQRADIAEMLAELNDVMTQCKRALQERSLGA